MGAHQQFIDKIIQINSNRIDDTSDEICDIILKIFDKNQENVQIIRRNAMNMRLYHVHYKQYTKECNFIHCKNRKITMDKFYKCKQCMMVYYCSRYCFKRDWNMYHRQNCIKLQQLRHKYLA